MKIKVLLAIMTCVLVLTSSSNLFSADSGEVLFCESINDKLEPAGTNTEFETNEISLLAFALDKEPFNVLSVILSIYNQKGSDSQELIHRETRDINPAWNVLALKNIPFPDKATYYVAINSPDGKLISSGLVTIKEKTVEKEIPEENVIEGASLQSLFESYKSKAVTQE
jgi:hypothetical protein